MRFTFIMMLLIWLLLVGFVVGMVEADLVFGRHLGML